MQDKLLTQSELYICFPRTHSLYRQKTTKKMLSEFSLIVNIYRDLAYLCTFVHFNVWITLMFRIT